MRLLFVAVAFRNRYERETGTANVTMNRKLGTTLDHLGFLIFHIVRTRASPETILTTH